MAGSISAALARSAAMLLWMLCSGWLVTIAHAESPPPVAWTAEFNGTSNNNDFGRGMVTDHDGNVIVIGNSCQGFVSVQCSNSSDHFDYVTIKYDAAGNTLWTTQFNGDAGNHDIPVAVAVDGAGNVYVTGSSCSAGDGSNLIGSPGCLADYQTLKYDPAGNLVWSRRYNGPADLTDLAGALTVDPAGNVYVTGASCENVGGTCGGLSPTQSYATVKYDTDGNLLWVDRRFGHFGTHGGKDIALGSTGELYVTGIACFDVSSSVCHPRITTLKYQADGTFLWNAIYPEDQAVPELSTPTLTPAPDGGVFVGGTLIGGTPYVLLKYDATGGESWAVPFGGLSSQRSSLALAANDAGDIYAAGSHGCSISTCNLGLFKFDGTGQLQWDTIINSAGFGGPSSLVLDGVGNSYLAGSKSTAATLSDIAVFKFDVAGTLLWTVTHNGPADAQDGGGTIALDPQNNIVVTGGTCRSESSRGNCNNRDITTIKYAQAPVDAIPPVTVAQVIPAANAAGWNNGDVTVNLTATDDGGTGVREIHHTLNNSSEIVTAGADAVVSVNDEGIHDLEFFAVDNADNTETAQTLAVKIDTTPPQLVLPGLAPSRIINSTVVVAFDASDNLSGVASLGATLDGDSILSGTVLQLTQPGPHQFEMTADDHAGNVATGSESFAVVYDFGGFLPPLSADSRTLFRLGSTIPVKFRLTDANGISVTTAVAILVLQQFSGEDPVGDPVDATPTGGADTGNLFRFADDQYIYNLNTSPLSGGTWELRAVLDDGTTHAIQIGLKSK